MIWKYFLQIPPVGAPNPKPEQEVHGVVIDRVGDYFGIACGNNLAFCTSKNFLSAGMYCAFLLTFPLFKTILGFFNNVFIFIIFTIVCFWNYQILLSYLGDFSRLYNLKHVFKCSHWNLFNEKV